MMGKFTVWSSAMMKIPSSASEKMARCVKARTSVAPSVLLMLLRKVKKVCVCVCARACSLSSGTSIAVGLSSRSRFYLRTPPGPSSCQGTAATNK